MNAILTLCSLASSASSRAISISKRLSLLVRWWRSGADVSSDYPFTVWSFGTGLTCLTQVVFGNVIGYLKMNKVALLDTSGKFPDIRNFAKETYLSKRMWEMVTTSKTKNSRIFSQDVVMYDDYRFARRTEIEEFPSLSDDDAFAGDDSDDDMDAEDVL